MLIRQVAAKWPAAFSVAVLVTLFATVGPLIAQDGGVPGSESSAYFPLAPGSRWVYRGSGGKVDVRVARREKSGGVMCARLEHSVGGRIRQSELVAAGAGGVYRHAVSGKSVEPPLRLLAFPHKPGENWKIDSRIAGKPLRGTFIGGTETIETPAGKFSTLRVSTEDCRVGEQPVKSTCWYARDVGLIKQVVEIDGRTVLLELESYTPAARDNR